ncbi:hypothetical protein TL16_g03038 [Triparma laevis f. inornata]|uniref:Proteasome alpha-type subunits domain-containing protein n=2 Tax=Triparma laevis TaxID=1534972 RepID=A0A9W7L1A4_9STRA|nr:hypothetical protein TL16_g03038 [Triparma laevis f. inornata]GMI18531.1 hypothetical protein TrLO_g14885 [Triparma laevis f. longispina]
MPHLHNTLIVLLLSLLTTPYIYAMPSLPAHSSRTTSKDYPYSFSLSTFNPEGRLIQVELANKAADRGTPSVAFLSNSGNSTVTIMTPVELPSNLTIAPIYNKIFSLTPTISMTYSGISSDYRLLTKSVVQSLEDFHKRFACYPPINDVVVEVAKVLQSHTTMAGVRPLGLKIIVVGEGRMFRIGAGGDILEAKSDYLVIGDTSGGNFSPLNDDSNRPGMREWATQMLSEAMEKRNGIYNDVEITQV